MTLERAIYRLVTRLGLRCLWLGRHFPVRVPLGYRCGWCGLAGDGCGVSLRAEYVPGLRRLYDRARGERTRTTAWERSSRGTW